MPSSIGLWIAMIKPAYSDGYGAVPQQGTPLPSVPIADKGRFSSARRNLGSYATSGDSDSMKKAVGHYSGSGLGGSRNATARMGRTSQNAGALYSALSSLAGREGGDSSPQLDYQALSGQSANSIVDQLANAISPSDGSQDAEANRDSISQAMRDLIKDDPNVDLSSLDEAQIGEVVESYIAYDICRRLELDIGKSLFNKTDAITASRRLEEIRRYVKQSVAAGLREVTGAGERMTATNASRIAQSTITRTYDIFEEYLL
jgi:hypothetical protein